jgi:hypothetical protein
VFASPRGGAASDRDGEVMLLRPGQGDVAASDLQVRLDRIQLLAELALAVGQDRAADLAAEKLSAAELAAMIPLLQPVALHRTTRTRIVFPGAGSGSPDARHTAQHRTGARARRFPFRIRSSG